MGCGSSVSAHQEPPPVMLQEANVDNSKSAQKNENPTPVVVATTKEQNKEPAMQPSTQQPISSSNFATSQKQAPETACSTEDELEFDEEPPPAPTLGEYTGAPKPADEAERIAYLQALQILDTESEDRYDKLTKLGCELFKVPICLISLVDNDRQWFKSVQGLGCNSTSRACSFCAWTLLPSHPEMLIVEDATKDARFHRNPLVTGDPFIRFYAGSPMVGCTGLRLGSFCIIDSKPRTLDASSALLLSNLGELAARELERSYLEKNPDVALAAKARSAVSINDGVLLANLSQPSWPVLLVIQLPGSDNVTQRAHGVNFWELFKIDPLSEAQLRKAQLEAIPNRGNFQIWVQAAREEATHRMLLSFKSATGGALAPYTPLIGIPPEVPYMDDPNAPLLYFATCMGTLDLDDALRDVNEVAKALMDIASEDGLLEMPHEGGKAQKSPELPAPAKEVVPKVESTGTIPRASIHTSNQAFSSVRLGPLLGEGRLGKVYRGMWQDKPVAVKVILHSANENMLLEEMEHSQEVSGMMETEIIVQKYLQIQRLADGGEPGREMMETWVVMELCTHGSLGRLVAKGWLMEAPDLLATDVRALLNTATEIAKALVQLHERGLVHGNLNANNVLLTNSSHGSPAVRLSDNGSHSFKRASSPGSPPSSIAHSAPEVVAGSEATQESDVFAFGMLLWEMYMGYEPFRGRKKEQVARLVQMGKVPPVNLGCPMALKNIITQCTIKDPQDRPAMREVLHFLAEYGAAM